MPRRRSEQLKQEHARIHQNTMKRLKSEGEKRRKKKREAQE